MQYPAHKRMRKKISDRRHRGNVSRMCHSHNDARVIESTH